MASMTAISPTGTRIAAIVPAGCIRSVVSIWLIEHWAFRCGELSRVVVSKIQMKIRQGAHDLFMSCRVSRSSRNQMSRYRLYVPRQSASQFRTCPGFGDREVV